MAYVCTAVAICISGLSHGTQMTAYGHTLYMHPNRLALATRYSMRYCHWIKPNARSESPTRLITFRAWTYELSKDELGTEYGMEFIRLCRSVKDTNTNTWSHQWQTVTTAAGCWTYLDACTPDKTRTYMLCEDPSLHLPLISAFSKSLLNGWKLMLAVIPPSPTICRWRKGSKSVTLLGASNIWPTQFASCLTGRTGCEHLKQSEEDVQCEHVQQIDKSVSVLRDTMLEWWRFLLENDLGGFSPTAGSQSMRVWRHKYLTQRVLIDCHDDALRLAREAVYGARCEVFVTRRHAGEIVELDTNGSYGGIMRDMRVPVRLLSHRYHITVRECCEWVRDSVLVGRVRINCPQPLFPMRKDGRPSFISGRFDTVLAGEALEYALEHGHVDDVFEVAVYEPAPAFSAYMQALWSLRKMSESLGLAGDAEKYKLLSNSFWGRWAQHGRQWEKVRDVNTDRILSWIDYNEDDGELTEWRQFGGIVQKLVKEEESRDSSPAIAACILAAGHMQLWRYIERAGLDHVYYCDTDSIFTDAVGVERLRELIKPHELGKLKVKGVYDSATFFGQKHIVLDGKRRLAGVPELSVQSPDGTTLQTQSQHVSAWIRSGREPRAGTKEVKKRFKKEV